MGITGCRIIDSKRERLIAMMTNAFVPCNGRFPTLVALIALFLAVGGGFLADLSSAAILSFLIILSIFATMACSKLLSVTWLRGIPSSFALELPPYRTPKVGQVILRSVLDRTLRVLGRAVAVAAPAGLLLWLSSNIIIGELSLLGHAASFLDPAGRFLGLDGVILLGFLLALPANEIVLPVILMGYTASGCLVEYESLASLHDLLVANGWTVTTAVCVILLMLFHYPCATALLTIKREMGKLRYVFLAALLPTLLGILLCFLVSFASNLFV